jgi:probable HAF family extracellular repeat protein
VRLTQLGVFVLIALLAELLAPAVRADAIYSVTYLGPATATANASGQSQTTPSSQYPFLVGANQLNTNGDYLSALSPSQQASFQAGSFDLYAHPATTSLSGATFFQSYGPGYDVVDNYQSYDYINSINLTTTNNVGVSVGTASETTSPGPASRLVTFTADPHTVSDPYSSSQPTVQSPGYVNPIQTQSDATYNQFYGAVSGINDHNIIALTEYQWNAQGQAVLIPHVSGLITSTGYAGDQSLGSLGGANGAAYAINNSNQIVGWSQLANGDVHAFVWSNGVMQDLNLMIPPLSGITLVSAVGIDAEGDIAAYGTNSSGQMHEYLLTPLEAPVPEPGTLAVFALGIVALVAQKARTRRRAETW